MFKYIFRYEDHEYLGHTITLFHYFAVAFFANSAINRWNLTFYVPNHELEFYSLQPVAFKRRVRKYPKRLNFFIKHYSYKTKG